MLDAPTDTLLVNRRNLPFALDGGIAQRAAIGLVVLATDQTIEHEWRQMLHLDGVAFYESRIYNSPTITRETLLSRVWGPEYRDASHYVRLYINYLRQKLEDDPANPRYILTERGVGYRFFDYAHHPR